MRLGSLERYLWNFSTLRNSVSFVHFSEVGGFFSDGDWRFLVRWEFTKKWMLDFELISLIGCLLSSYWTEHLHKAS